MNRNNDLMYQANLCLLNINSAAALLTLWGILAIFRTQALNGLQQHYLTRQIVWAAAAWGIFLLMRKISMYTLFRLALPAAAVGLLTMGLLPVCGLRINGMRGWYELGFFTLQPSELFKAFYVLVLVFILHMRRLPSYWKLPLALSITGAFALLLLLQPDFGTMIICMTGGFGALYFGAARTRTLLLLTVAAIIFAVIAVQLHPYMSNRIMHFLHPELDPSGGSWHLRQFSIAIARGEFSGVKGAMAVWSNSFLPLAHNDSIFAALCEIQGFWGGVLLLGLYFWLFFSIFQLGKYAVSPLRRNLINSLLVILAAQTFMHILVNVGLLPPTGVTLPLISYGGSSLLGIMLLLAIINIAGRPAEGHPAIKY